MNIDKIKQTMREQNDAPMLYLLPPKLKQLLLDDAPGCNLSMGNDGSVVFTEPDGSKTSLSTTYRDAVTRERIMKSHGVE